MFDYKFEYNFKKYILHFSLVKFKVSLDEIHIGYLIII